jgi:2-oxoglutarate dehydrogenase complex dehydrogenase (E1) component-like enzyme
VRERLSELIGPDRGLHYAGRMEAASPAVGSARIHKKEQTALVRDAIGED